MRLHMALLLALITLSVVHQRLTFNILLHRVIMMMILILLLWDFFALVVPVMLIPQLTRPAVLLLALDAVTLLFIAGIQFAGETMEENRQGIRALEASRYQFATL